MGKRILSSLCITTYVQFAGSKIKCYFYLEVLQKQNVKIQAFCYVWRKRAMSLFLLHILNEIAAMQNVRYIFNQVSVLIIN